MWKENTVHGFLTVKLSVSLTEVESHPFPLDTMLFMDWRDDHLTPGTDMQAANTATPTFLYAMPFTATKVSHLCFFFFFLLAMLVRV